MSAAHVFQDFFDCCVGDWVTERTYHYLTHQQVERSHTEFTIHPLSPVLKKKVITDNGYEELGDLSPYPGYHLAFETVSEAGERVAHSLNMLFVYEQSGDLLVGDYLRDRAYEEAKPMVAKFQFDPQLRELKMQTIYTRIVSVDTITLVNPSLRIRNILNYHRPPADQPLTDVALVGFGVEQKQSN
ncbi:phycobiliprotein lyase [Lyngbya confervoides]|uniref:Chromophore lyase CpcS/CpeS n=1 Tax=Lyngbya confervoides BDU141951 TaxID=1574623 RepID=A0ABD4T7J2_9CYAN|nr:phycobiliprotein lyase [Lyngbya confervoides]MCM1984428.1 phycobiliprotein lyase [Lyngbya confervoides BDU141951]